MADSGEEVTVLPVEEAGEGADMSRAAPAESIIETEEQPLTEENISYLESENAPAMDEESGSRQDDEEAEISEEPVEEVFNDWGEGAVDDGSGTEPGAEAASDDTESVPRIEESEVAGNDAPVLEAGVAVLDEEAAGEDTAAPVMEAEVAEESHAEDAVNIPENMKEEIKSVLSYMDQLLESLPEDKISQFAKSEEFNTYKKLFKELGLA
mgnify:CR=1 FL=1